MNKFVEQNDVFRFKTKGKICIQQKDFVWFKKGKLHS